MKQETNAYQYQWHGKIIQDFREDEEHEVNMCVTVIRYLNKSPISTIFLRTSKGKNFICRP